MWYILLLIGVWFSYWGVNYLIADLNLKERASRIKTHDPRQINHPVWALYYILVCSPQYFIFKDWYFLASVLMLHIAVFPVIYNLKDGNPPFFLSKTTTALSDRIMNSIGLKSSELVNVTGLLISVALLVISFFQNH